MAIIVSQVKTTLEESSNQDRIWEAARKTARLKPEEIEKTYLVKSSIDARKQDHILLVSSVGFELKHPEEESLEQLMRREQEKRSVCKDSAQPTPAVYGRKRKA